MVMVVVVVDVVVVVVVVDVVVGFFRESETGNGRSEGKFLPRYWVTIIRRGNYIQN